MHSQFCCGPVAAMSSDGEQESDSRSFVRGILGSSDDYQSLGPKGGKVTTNSCDRLILTTDTGR